MDKVEFFDYGPYPPPPLYTVYVYYHTMKEGWGGGRVEAEKRLEGQQFSKLGRKYQHNYKL
jgi:hypothetical protein